MRGVIVDFMVLLRFVLSIALVPAPCVAFYARDVSVARLAVALSRPCQTAIPREKISPPLVRICVECVVFANQTATRDVRARDGLFVSTPKLLQLAKRQNK